MTTAPNGALHRQDFHLQVSQLVSLRSLLQVRLARLTRRDIAVVHFADLSTLHQTIERTGHRALWDPGGQAHLSRTEPLRTRGRDRRQDLRLATRWLDRRRRRGDHCPLFGDSTLWLWLRFCLGFRLAPWGRGGHTGAAGLTRFEPLHRRNP